MDFYVDTAPVVAPVYTFVAPFEPNERGRNDAWGRTQFSSVGGGVVDFFSDEKGAWAPTSLPSAKSLRLEETTTLIGELRSSGSGRSISKLDSDIEKIAAQRVRLMAINYADKGASKETLARLEILNRRLLDRSPRVSKEQVSELELAGDRLLRIRASREERAKRLGLVG